MTRPIDADDFRRRLDDYYPFTKEEQSKHALADIAKSSVLLALAKTPTLDVVPFDRFRLVCKFYAVAYDDYIGTELTCRRKDMIPEGCSWGICDEEHCPYLKEEE